MQNHFRKIKTIVITAVVTILIVIIYANIRRPQAELAYEVLDTVSVRDPQFVSAIGDLLDPAFVDGNKIETLLNGDQIFPAMLDAIQSAKKSVTFESYIYWSGHVGELFAHALADRARAGVPVHLMLDWAGSGKADPELIKLMQAAGVEVERYHKPEWYNITRLNNRDHRKILVVDGRIGFTGGVGISDDWSGNGLDQHHWRDTHFRVEGPAVNQMQSAFMDNWLKLRPEVHTSEKYFSTNPHVGSSKAQMFISSSSEGGSSARILYLLAIESARKSIFLQSAYFVPDDHAVERLLAARKRGVEISIMVPGDYTDSTVVDHASRDLWGELLKVGVRFYRYGPAMFHCKVLVVDEYFTSVGSTNFDERSFRLNDEANLNVLDETFARQQIAQFELDRTKSKEMSYQEWQNRPIIEKISSKLMKFLNSQL